MPALFEKQNEFQTYIEQRAKELYPEHEWDVAAADTGLKFNYNMMSSEVFQTCYEERPDLFENVNWITGEDDFPLFVKPGYDEMYEEYCLTRDDDDDL